MIDAKVLKSLVLTQQELKEFLHYDPETGIFTWAKSNNTSIKVGGLAGCIMNCGYLRIGINKKQHLAHRLAWLYVTGKMPKNLIDHINGNRSDNRFCNLREATNAENMQNITKLPTTNKSGVLGVCWHKQRQKWYTQIMANGKKIYVGIYDTIEEAKIARLQAKEKYHKFESNQ